MNENPKPEYEVPKVEEVNTADAPAVTAAGGDSTPTPSDLRLKHSLRPLGERQAIHADPEPGYEAPKVEEVNTADYPVATAAGDNSTTDGDSDLRLKRSLRALDARITGPR